MINNLITNPVRTVGGFASGFRYPLVAAFFILRHPSLWPWCIIPIIINIVVIVMLWIWTGHFAEQMLDSYVTVKEGWFWESVRKAAVILAFLGRVIVTLVAFVVVGTFAALPFNDFLSEHTDKLAGGWKDPRPFSPARTAWELTVTGLQEGKRMAMYLAIILPLFVLTFIPVIAPFALALKLMATAMFFTSDYLSYPMERRGALLFRHKFMIARRYFFPSLGFGLAVTMLALVPIINFLFFPLAVVGGTLLFSDLVRQYGDGLRQGLPEKFNPYGPPFGTVIPPAGKTADMKSKPQKSSSVARPLAPPSDSAASDLASEKAAAPPPPPPPPPQADDQH